MEAVVSGSQLAVLRDGRGIVGCKSARGLVELELEYGVGAVATGDVGDESEPVRRVGLHGVGASAGRVPLGRRSLGNAVVVDWMHRTPALDVVGGEQPSPCLVGGQEVGVGLQWGGAQQRQRARAGVDPVAGELVDGAPCNVQELATGIGGKRRRSSRSLDLVEFFERAGVGVLAENQDAVVAGRGYVDEDGHVSQYLSR